MGRALAAQPENGRPEHETEKRQRLIPDGQVRAVIGGVVAGVVLAGAGQSAAVAAMPVIIGDTGSLVHLSWPVTAYLLGAAVTMPLHGKLSDVFGRRPAYLLAMMIFMAGAAFAGQATTMAQLVASSAMQGVGAGGLLTLGFVILGDLTAPHRRASDRGYLVATWAVATLAGPAIGGVLADRFGWRWIFFANLPAGAIVLAVVGLALTVHIRPQERDLDLVGALLLALGLGLVLLYISWHGPVRGWTSSSSLVLLAEGSAALVLFLARENRASEPLLPMALLRERTLVRATLTGVILGSAVFGLLLVFPLYAQVIAGVPQVLSGLLLVPVAIGAAGAAAGVAKIEQDRVLAPVGAAVVLASMLVLAWRPPSAVTWEPMLVLLLTGAGLGVAWRVLARIARDAAPPGQVGAAVALGLFLQVIGSSIGGALLGAVLCTGLARYGPIDLLTTVNLRPEVLRALPDADRDAVFAAFNQALQLALIAAAVVAACALLLSFTIKTVAVRDQAELAAWESATELVKAPARVRKPEPQPPEPRPAPVLPTLSKPPAQVAAPPPSKPPEPLPEEVVPEKPAKPPKPPKPPREYPWTHWPKQRKLVVASSSVIATLATIYVGGLAYAGAGVLRGTTVHGVAIGNLQPAEAEQKIAQVLGPEAAAPVPLKAGVQVVTIDPRMAGLGLDPRATVAGSARGSFNPIQLFTVIFTADRNIPLRTTSDPVRLHAAMEQVDRQVHRDPTDGTILFTTGTPQIVESRDGQTVDIPRAAIATNAGYMQRPIGIPLIVLPPRVSNAEIGRAMDQFARPAVSAPITVNAEGKTAVLPPGVFASHLGVVSDPQGRLHPTVDADGVLRDGGQLLGPLQSWPKAEVSKTVRGKKVIVEPGYDGHVIGKEDLANAMVNAFQDGSRVANVPLTTVHP